MHNMTRRSAVSCHEAPSSVDQIIIVEFLLLGHGFISFLETVTSDRNIIGRDKRLEFLGFRIYQLSFYLNSPFKQVGF